jgi:hypothetical protein
MHLVNQCIDSYVGTCVLDKQPLRPYGDTDMARHFPTFPPSLSHLPSPPSPHPTFLTARSLTSVNGDICRKGDWVLYSPSTMYTGAPALGRIHEIVVSLDVAGAQFPRPDPILLQQADIAQWVDHYRMPMVSVSSGWAVVNIEVSGLLSNFDRL